MKIAFALAVVVMAGAGGQAPGTLAESLFREGRFVEALDEARKTPSSSADAKAWFWLGAAAAKSGYLEEAERAYLRAVGLDPGYAAALNNLGDIYERREEWLKAEQYYHLAVAAQPGNSAPYAGLGDIFRKNGAWKRAIVAYREAVAHNPKDALSARFLEACERAATVEAQGPIPAETLLALSGAGAEVRRSIRTRGLEDRLDEQPAEAPRLAFHIGFPRDQFALRDLSSSARAQLDQLAAALRSPEWQGRKITVEGYTCSCGSAQANEVLGSKRAATVAGYLISHGAVLREAVKVLSYGDRKPISEGAAQLSFAACERDAAHSQNRRVVIRRGWQQPGGKVTAAASLHAAFWSRSKATSRFLPLKNGDVLRSYDQIKVTLLATHSVYAYVVHHDSGGKWSVVFPNAKFAKESPAANPLEPDRLYSIPGVNLGIPLDSKPGEEETMVFVSPGPDPEIERLVAQVLSGQPVTLQFADEPASRPRIAKSAAKSAPPVEAQEREPEPPPAPRESTVRIRTRGLQEVVAEAPEPVALPIRSVARVKFAHRP